MLSLQNGGVTTAGLRGLNVGLVLRWLDHNVAMVLQLPKVLLLSCKLGGVVSYNILVLVEVRCHGTRLNLLHFRSALVNNVGVHGDNALARGALRPQRLVTVSDCSSYTLLDTGVAHGYQWRTQRESSA